MERNTIQLRLISSIVERMHPHATADEIYQEVIKEHPSVGKSTVYRNLAKMCEQGKLRKRIIPGRPDSYDLICTDHYHIRCVECDRVFDVDMDFVGDLEASVKDKHGFTFIAHDIVFTGVCPDCIALKK